MAYSHDHPAEDGQRLFVTNGELRGVSVPLEVGELRVGSSSDCDVVLLGADDSESEVSIVVSDDGFALRDAIGDIRIGQKVLKATKRKVLKAGVPFLVGDTEMMITRSLEDADKSSTSYRQRSTRLACVASAAVLVGVIAVVVFAGGRGTVIAKPAALESRTNVSSESPSIIAVVAANAMQGKLDESGLRRLTASADRINGTVKVRGSVRKNEFASWRDASKWFDTKYGRSVMLDAHVDTAADSVTLPFSINAVWMGDSPRLTLHDGSQRFAGDFLPGGWRLDKIGKDSVTIWKDGESLTVPL